MIYITREIPTDTYMKQRCGPSVASCLRFGCDRRVSNTTSKRRSGTDIFNLYALLCLSISYVNASSKTIHEDRIVCGLPVVFYLNFI